MTNFMHTYMHIYIPYTYQVYTQTYILLPIIYTSIPLPLPSPACAHPDATLLEPELMPLAPRTRTTTAARGLGSIRSAAGATEMFVFRLSHGVFDRISHTMEVGP